MSEQVDALEWRRQIARQFNADMDAHLGKPVGLEGAEGRSGATDQGEPGRTLAADCPSHITRPHVVFARDLATGDIVDRFVVDPGDPSWNAD